MTVPSGIIDRVKPVVAVGVVALLVVVAAGCDGDTVAGRPVETPRSSSVAPAQSGARFADPSAASALATDVRAGVEAVNTYDYRSIAASRANAVRYTTGQLSVDLTNTYQNVIAKNAVAQRVTQQARVQHVGVASMNATTASLLVLGTLRITLASSPKPRVDSFTLGVHATKVSSRWLLSKLDTSAVVSSPAPGTEALADALTASRDAAVALSTYRRSTFAADFARALSLTTGSLRTEIQGHREVTRKALTDGGFDLSATAPAAAVETAQGSSVTALVLMNGYRVTAGNTRSAPTPQRLRVTVVATGGRWLASDIESVGVS